MEECAKNDVPQGSNNLPADSDRVKAPVVGAGSTDFGGNQTHDAKEKGDLPTPSWVGKWGTILALLEEQQKSMEALQKAFLMASNALPKNAPMPVKDNMAKALEHMGSMRSTSLALKAARDSFDKELSESRLTRKVRRQRERAVSLGNIVSTPQSTPRNEKRGASQTPEGSTPKRKDVSSKVHATIPKHMEMDTDTGDTRKGQEDGGPWQEAKKKKKKTPKKKEEAEPKKRSKRVRRSRPSDAIKLTAKVGQSYADILKDMKKGVNPASTSTEVLSIRRTRKEEILIVLKRGQDNAAFSQALTSAIGSKADVKPLIVRETLEIMDLDETTTEDETIEAVRTKLGKADMEIPCKLFSKYGKAKVAVIQLPQTDAETLKQEGKIRIGWINCRIRERVEVPRCFKCLGYGHTIRNCSGPDRKESCWKCGEKNHKHKECTKDPKCTTCADKGIVETNHISGSRFCPTFRLELKKRRKVQ